MMTPLHPLLELVQQDRRYRLEAYLFVDESLAFAQQLLDVDPPTSGGVVAPDPADLSAIENEGADIDGPNDADLKAADLETADQESGDPESDDLETADPKASDRGGADAAADDTDTDDGTAAADDAEDEHHLTGQELCEAIRRYSLDQYGLMAKCVFNSWGVHSTSDFGEIVFKMIEIGRMKKTESDRREDFDDVFDFDQDLAARFKIELPPQSA